MAIFKDKTGRGEVDYAKSPVRGSDGTILYLNDHTGTQKNIFAQGSRNHLVFQLRGETNGVADISDNKFSITESSELTKRLENVTHDTKLKTFEFTGGKTITFEPKIQNQTVRQFAGRSGALYSSGTPGGTGADTIQTILPYIHDNVHVVTTGGGFDGSGPYLSAAECILSFWVYVESYGTGTNGGGSCIMETVSGNNRSLGVVLSSSGQLIFRYYDFGANSTNATNFQQIMTQKSISLKQWTHVTIFFSGYGDFGAMNTFLDYNTRGLNEPWTEYRSVAQGGLPQVEIFINGVRQKDPSESGNTSGDFTAKLGTFSGVFTDQNFPLVLGTGLAGYDNLTPQFQSGADANFNGRLAEVSYFYTHFFGQTDGFRLRNANYRQITAQTLMTGRVQPTSGITNVSERLLLRDLDQNSTHPTVKRSGDQRRLGNHLIQFDDSRAQTLKGATVQYPTKLVEGDNLIDTIYGGYFNGDLTLSHTASVESYDTFYRREDQPAHEPFVESRIYIDSGSSFYQTGTLDSVMPGFSTSLRNKDSIHIKLSSTADLRLGLRSNSSTNGTVGSPNDFNNQDTMAYFNASTNLFDKLLPRTFPGTTNSDSDVFAARNLTGSCVAFAHQYQVLSASTTASLKVLTSDYDDFLDVNHPAEFAANLTLSKFPDSYYNASGRPISDFGFPDDSRYDASSSQVIKMSNYISEPFVVEKIVIKTPALEPSPRSNYGEGYNLKSAMNRDFFAFDIASQPLIVGGTYAGQTYPTNTPGEALTVTAAITRGSFLFTPFLMRQTIGRQSGSLNLNYVVTDGPAGSVANGQQLPVTQSYSSEFTRDLITYGNAFFYTPENHRAAGVGLNSRDYLVRTAAYRNGFANDTRTATMIMRLTSSINNTGIDFGGEGDRDATVRIIDSCYPHYEHRIPYGTDAYSSNFPTGSEGLVFELKPKLIFPLTCAGIVARTPSPIAETGTTGLCSHTLAWKGGASNISQISSARNFGPSQTGRKNPQTIELVTSFDDPESAGSENSITRVSVSATEGSENSLYVLHPNDELIFGLHKNPNLESNNNQAQSIIVKAGDFDITLFGSYLRNSQPRQFELNQLLNNDIVHEAIGQEPISDQFDVEPRSAFSGSYADEVMSGSTIAPYNGFNASVHRNGDGSSDFTDLARGVAGRSSEGTQGVTGSLRRTVSIASSDKTEYDSFLFDLESMFAVDLPNDAADGVNNYENDLSFGSSVKLDFAWLGNLHAPEGYGEFGERKITANRNIRGSFLNSRYNDVNRVRQQQIGAQNNSFLLEYTGSIANGRLDSGFGADNSNATAASSGNNLIVDSKENGIVDAGFVAKFIFGIGNGTNNSHIVKDPTISLPAGQYFVFDEIIRGFRYGLSNITDKKPRNVFRRDRYGQLRDMLEMAPNTAYIDDASNTISYAVEAQFFADDGSIASPDATSSSNLSTYVTSSAPFFDREVVEFDDPLVVRNRGPLNNKVVDLTIEI